MPTAVSGVGLQRLATAIRLRAVQMVAPHGLGYLGQALSSAEAMAAIYSLRRLGVDRVLISPGHYVVAAYAAAAELGDLDPELLTHYGCDDSPVDAIGGEGSPGLDYTCGSLGQGLSAGVGFALADRLAGNSDRHNYVVISDGELEEGQLWEAAMFAAHHGLDRVSVVVDANDSQVDGPVSSITTLEPMAEKWRAFGWDAIDVDGHDAALVAECLARASIGRPRVIIARTSTYHGLKCLPPTTDGHFVILPAALAALAESELRAELAQLDV